MHKQHRKQRKRGSQLPKLALMATLVTYQAQAALVNPNQEEWLWRDVPSSNTSASSTGESGNHGGGSTNPMFWYWLGHTMSNLSSGSGGSSTSSNTYKPAPNIGANLPSSSASSNHAPKGYSTGGMGNTGGRSGASSSSGG